MPELPEVEAVRRYLLSEGLVGCTIERVELLWPRAVRTPAAEQFKFGLTGRRIANVRRRGKFLLLDMAGRPPATLALHLRMTGSLAVAPSGDPRPKYTRNVLSLDGGHELCFVDPRKFGMMWLVRDEAEVVADLGAEPLQPDFTVDALGLILGGRRAPVKPLLCDQTLVAGIGNIYADEALFLASIHPLLPGAELSHGDLVRLHGAITTTLVEAIERLAPVSPSESQPAEVADQSGLFQVPRSEGVPCLRCGAPIARITIRGRSAYFCPQCQPPGAVPQAE